MALESAVGGFDLHTHSTRSDGTTSPAELAAEVAVVGLAGFSLTDHDTTEGWDEAREASARLGIDFLPGIELTTSHAHRSVHLLGYGIDPSHADLVEELSFLVESRLTRAQRMVDLLSRDFELDWDAVLAEAHEGANVSVGRPHLADALVGAGYFQNRTEAFERALSTRGPYYVPTYSVETTRAIELVREAGGFPVLAHPAAFRMRGPVPINVVETFARHGLGGVELNHPENRADWLPPLRGVTETLGLLVTGSSDYHGIGKPNRLGEHVTSEHTVAQIRAEVATPR